MGDAAVSDSATDAGGAGARSAQSAVAAPLLELRGIRKHFGALEVLKGVTLTARPGEVVTLIGSSGSGKSTLLRCANLLETPQDGDILFEGTPIRWRAASSGFGAVWRGAAERRPADPAQVRALRARLSMVFQQFNLWAHLTILENVIEAPMSVLGKTEEAAKDAGHALLEKVGIGDKADAYPAQLSGGQQQRAAIARALAMEPAALLLDEPTSALDPELEAEVARVIRSLAEEGRTMVLVTHDMRLARENADRTLFLHKGEIEEEGRPDAVFGAPRSERLRQFLAASG